MASLLELSTRDDWRNMVLRLSGLVGTFIFAIALAKTLGMSSVYGGGYGYGDTAAVQAPYENTHGADQNTQRNCLQNPRTQCPAVPEIASGKNNKPSGDYAKTLQEFYRRIESGQKSSQDIEEEIAKLVTDAAPIHWNSKDIQHSYKLALVATHIKNLDNNFELLFMHTLADSGTAESMATYYTSRINAADEKNIHGSFVYARMIEGKKGRQPQFHPASRGQYFFSLKPDTFAGNFGLRSPEGRYQIATVNEGSFDPLSILTTEDGQIDEIGDYQYERTIAGSTYSILVIPRLTDYETLVIEVKIREISSLLTTTYIMVYEQI